MNPSGSANCFGTAGRFIQRFDILDDDGSCAQACSPSSCLNLDNTPVRLAPLADNGGPTETHAIIPGQPPVDAVDSGRNPCPAVDQRGEARPAGAGCDIGAFEAAAAPNLEVTKTADKADVGVGDTLTYSVAVTNRGNADAPDVVVTDVLPGEVSFVSAATTKGTCSESSGTVTCPIGTLSGGETATVTVTTTVDDDSGAIVDVAGATTSGADPDPTDDVDAAALYPPHGFSDVPAWVEDAVRWIRFFDYASGYANGTFRPSLNISRGQVVRMLYRLAGSPDVSALPPHGLSDVPAWVEDAVRWAVADPDGPGPLEPVFSGYANGTFRPKLSITRAQVTRALYRFASLPDVSGLPPHGFSDVPAWVEDAVRWIADRTTDLPLATGYANGTYRPSLKITRAQVTRMLFRLFLLLNPPAAP